MKNSKAGKAALTAAAVILTASLSVNSAIAYFTTYCTAEGSYSMEMGFPSTDIDEKVDEEGKHIVIQNTGNYDCYVRVKVFAPSFTGVEQKYSGEGWSQNSEDGYWYYNSVLAAGKDTNELLVTYTIPKPEGEEVPDDFNIIVVYEYVPVLYDEKGNPDMTESWNNVAAIISSETSTEPDAGEEEGATETEPGAGEDAGAEQGGE